jgi:Protein of unknown function (DUF1552)
MPQFRLSRRAVLRGAGSVAIALPWLEIMTPEPARAAGAPAKRFVSVFTPGGSVLENWRPSGDENNVILSPILEPLSEVKDKLLILDGVDMKSARGEQNQSGMIAWLTGTAQAAVGSPPFASGPSIDQVLAPRLSKNCRLPSLQLAVRWGTGKSHGLPSPINIANYADTETFDPIEPRLDPQQIWQDLFGSPGDVSPDRAWDKSILDAVGRRYATLAQRLGSADRMRLEQHLERIRELEVRLTDTSGRCTPPELVDTSDYDPLSGLNADDSGSIVDAPTDAAIPKVGKLMTDMLVMALACDVTAVASLQWSDTEAKHTFPWLGLNHHLSFYMNDGGYQPKELTTIFTWYSKQHAYLVEQLGQIPSASGSLLDETVIFFGSQLQNPATHEKTDMPFLLAGNGGGLRTDRWLKCNHASHNDLLVALFNLCGDSRVTFGAESYCSGPLAGLT